MLKLALTFELRSIVRGGPGSIALLGFLAAGSLAIVAGHQYVAQWQDAVTVAKRATAHSVAQALGEGSDPPAVDLSQALAQDRHAGSRLAREPGPLAGIAAGAVDPSPAAFQITFSADPMSAGGYRIENPELSAGAIDLVFVLALLMPLLVGVLGLGIGGRERESGLDRLIVIQAGTMRTWLIARTVAVVAVVGAAAAVICLAAGDVGGASAIETLALTAIALLYAVLWGGLLLVVNARAPTVRTAAFVFGGLWTALCLLVPAMAAEVAFARVESDFAVAETLNARTERFGVYQREIEAVLPEFYARFPQLKTLPAAATDETLDPSLHRLVHGGLVAAAIAEGHRARLDQDRAASILAERVAWFSPTVAISLSLERLAGVGPEAGASYRADLVTAVQARVAWVLERAWGQKPLSKSDFEALIAETPSSFRAHPVGLAGPTLALLVWTVMVWCLALWVSGDGVRGSDQGPRRQL